MDMRRTGGEEDSVDGDGAERIKAIVNDYDRKTGDGAWLKKTIAILRQSNKEAKAESTAEPCKSMRSVEGADLSGLRPENCQR